MSDILCPCCTETEECSSGCTFSADAPEDYETMQEFRRLHRENARLREQLKAADELAEAADAMCDSAESSGVQAWQNCATELEAKLAAYRAARGTNG